MKKGFKVFKKGEKYYWQNGRGRIGRGYYQNRFWNKEINDWAYKFKGLEFGVYYTLYFSLQPKLKFWQLS